MASTRAGRIGVLLALLWVGPGVATTIDHLPFPKIAKSADLIVRAVVMPGSRHVSMRGGYPWTCETLRIEKTMKGDAGASYELCAFGGEAGGTTYAIDGSIIPAEGTEGYFFLYAREKNYENPLVGWQQGAFGLSHDPATGNDRVSVFGGDPVIKIEPTSGSAATSATAAIGVVTDEKRGSKGMTAVEFEDAIRSALAATR